MKTFKKEFLEFVIEHKILTFGEFKLKSGRISPYFFNAGLFNTGMMLAKVAQFYAAALQDSGVQYDVLFGPAYKGIPLVSALSISLYNQYNIDAKYSFNRKELKTHGEGGMIVGSALKGDVIIIDDVITAGTAIREAVAILEAEGAKLKGVLIALDRQEKGKDTEKSAIQQVEEEYGINVFCIVTLSELLDYLKLKPGMEKVVESIAAYRSEFGVQ